MHRPNISIMSFALAALLGATPRRGMLSEHGKLLDVADAPPVRYEYGRSYRSALGHKPTRAAQFKRAAKRLRNVRVKASKRKF